MKHLLILFWMLLGARTALSQVSDKQLVPAGKIVWSDFIGSVDFASPYWARTDWHVSYTYRTTSFRYDTLRLNVKVQVLLKPTSWVLPNRQTDELLMHEQGHFNFALLLASLFKKAVVSTVFTKADYAQKVKELFANILTEVKQLEVQYDAETNHMKNKEAQLSWNKKLEELLKAAE
ncbi:MAG: DUF922 domain-containing protein [Janthinobacterium lividum]